MRNYFLLLLCCLCALNASIAQPPINQVSILSFNVKRNLPPDVGSRSEHGSALRLVVQKKPGAVITNSKMTVQIFSDGRKVCGNEVETAPMLPAFTSKIFSEKEILSYLGGCRRLVPGAYKIQIRFFNSDNYPVSFPASADFIVGEEKSVLKIHKSKLTASGNTQVFTKSQNAKTTER